MRDPSSFAIGIVLPVILILLYGYGVTFDVKHVPVAIVTRGPIARRGRSHGRLHAVALLQRGRGDP